MSVGPDWVLEKIRKILGDCCDDVVVATRHLQREWQVEVEVSMSGPVGFSTLNTLVGLDARGMFEPTFSTALGRGHLVIQTTLVVNVPRWIHRIDTVSDLVWGTYGYGSVGRGSDGMWWWKTVLGQYGARPTEDEAKQRLEDELG